MKHLLIIVLAFAAACGKDEPPAKTPTTTPKTETATPPVKAPEVRVPEMKEIPAVPSVDAAKVALDKSIADTKALIEKKQAEVKALGEKAKAEPMKALRYKADSDKLRKEIADLQKKLDGYTKEAAGK